MRHAPRFLGILFSTGILVGSAAAPAWATSIEDLIKLKANKTTPVSDDVLIALIESDGSVFHLTADDILPLKQKGLSERVIIAMLLTAKNARQTADAAAAIPAEQWDAAQPGPGTPVNAAPAPAPVEVNVTQTNTQTVEQPRQSRYATRAAYVPVYVPVAVPVVRQPPPQPVYWGFGGQRRPDTWAPDPQTAPDRNPATPPAPKKAGGGAQ